MTAAGCTLCGKASVFWSRYLSISLIDIPKAKSKDSRMNGKERQRKSGLLASDRTPGNSLSLKADKPPRSSPNATKYSWIDASPRMLAQRASIDQLFGKNSSRSSSVVQRVNIVGTKTTQPHPTQVIVNQGIVDNKIESLTNDRFEEEYVFAVNPRPSRPNGRTRRFISDGHHAYVAYRHLNREMDNPETTAVGASNYTWEDVAFGGGADMYSSWLKDKGRVDVARLNDLKSADDDDSVRTAVDALEDWEKTVISNSETDGEYNDVWEVLTDSNLEGSLREALVEDDTDGENVDQEMAGEEGDDGDSID